MQWLNQVAKDLVHELLSISIAQEMHFVMHDRTANWMQEISVRAPLAFTTPDNARCLSSSRIQHRTNRIRYVNSVLTYTLLNVTE